MDTPNILLRKVWRTFNKVACEEVVVLSIADQDLGTIYWYSLVIDSAAGEEELVVRSR